MIVTPFPPPPPPDGCCGAGAGLGAGGGLYVGVDGVTGDALEGAGSTAGADAVTLGGAGLGAGSGRGRMAGRRAIDGPAERSAIGVSRPSVGLSPPPLASATPTPIAKATGIAASQSSDGRGAARGARCWVNDGSFASRRATRQPYRDRSQPLGGSR